MWFAWVGKRVRNSTTRSPLWCCLVPVALIAACASPAPRLSIPELALETPAPEVRPEVTSDSPRLVPYPGLEVSYVVNADGEVYHYRGVYYVFLNRSWFHARTLDGPWSFIEMKYVPSDLFRVRGHLPPSLQG